MKITTHQTLVDSVTSIDLQNALWWDGPLSLVIGLFILLITGIFVSNFIGNEIIITGLRGEKKLTEKTEKELRIEVGAIADILSEVRATRERLNELEKKLTELK